MPDTRPGIKFDVNGICNPCVVSEERKKINWDDRKKELEQLCPNLLLNNP